MGCGQGGRDRVSSPVLLTMDLARFVEVVQAFPPHPPALFSGTSLRSVRCPKPAQSTDEVVR